MSRPAEDTPRAPRPSRHEITARGVLSSLEREVLALALDGGLPLPGERSEDQEEGVRLLLVRGLLHLHQHALWSSRGLRAALGVGAAAAEQALARSLRDAERSANVGVLRHPPRFCPETGRRLRRGRPASSKRTVASALPGSAPGTAPLRRLPVMNPQPAASVQSGLLQTGPVLGIFRDGDSVNPERAEDLLALPGAEHWRLERDPRWGAMLVCRYVGPQTGPADSADPEAPHDPS